MKSAIVHTLEGHRKPSDEVFTAALSQLQAGARVREIAAQRFLRQRCGYSKDAAKAALKG